METKLCVNEREYEILKLLGHGKGGYSYLALREGKLYVLKQIHHEPCDYYSFGNKIEAPNERIVKEYIEGPTIYDLVKQDAMKDAYLRQVREMAQTVYSAGLNIDYFPTNFIVCNDQIYYIDYECNPYMDEWNFENWGIKYWSKTQDFIDYMEKTATGNK